ncbi:Retron-type reverse transcriptase [Bradyrhizobium sp. SEMIA]|nr:Retron-type reverse transcriptase [Bradyrhizobium sp. SEMIA]
MMSPRASILGGSWWNEGNAGSRYANLDNWAENSNENIGARGRSDDGSVIIARRGPWPRRPVTSKLWSARFSCFGKHTARSGRAGRSGTIRCRRDPRPASPSCPPIGIGMIGSRAMARRYRNLIGKVTSLSNMEAALRLTAAGKRLTPGYLEFKEFSALNLADLARDMATGRYQAGEPHEFFILDPKRRLIQALPFRDRIAQQALCLVIGPIFDSAMLPRAYACRPGKGTHAGVIQLQSDLRREARAGDLYFLKTDFSRYFASIERSVLWRLIEAKISCKATLTLIQAMVPRSGIGLPIGSLTSQIFANVYAGATIDRHLQQDLGERLWYRYMDDLVVLGRSSEHLRALKDEIETYAARELGLRFSKWQVASVSRGVNFLGYRIWASHKLLRRDSVIRARRTIAALRARGDDERLHEFLAAWLGHASWADSGNLIKSLGLPQQWDKR